MKSFKASIFVCLFWFGLSQGTTAFAATLYDIQNISNQLIKANKLPYKPGVMLYSETPVAAIHLGKNGKNTLLINPKALKKFTYNEWAFIIGHEIAHLVSRKGNFRMAEAKADLRGARFAINAGYDPVKYLGGVLSRPDD